MRPPDPVVDHCRRVIKRGSRSFAKAAVLLDPEVRVAAYQLYAWCRYCDDLIDGQRLGHDAGDGSAVALGRERLAKLRSLTEAALAGARDLDPEFLGLARIVERHRIPRRHPFELLAGMAMDVEGRRYQTLDELTVYCYHVAGVVGVMMARMMGVRDPATLERASDLGSAMQLTNIARDVLDDARIGRVYLPLDWLDGAGVPLDGLGDPRHRQALSAVVARLLDHAELLYDRADDGIAHLPFRSAWSIAAARRIYAEIGHLVRARGTAAWDHRAIVPDWRKYLFLTETLLTTTIHSVRPKPAR